MQLSIAQNKQSGAVELFAVHIGDYYVPLGGASDSTNLIKPNGSSLWT